MKKREKLVAITIDYETWNPLPRGEAVDWETDIFIPAEELMQLGERCAVPITFFAEMGEYFWLEKFRPEIAERIASQLRNAIRRGHDVQLHLHPNWLPEAGARFENGAWYWNSSLQSLGSFPGDVCALIKRCKGKLEEIICVERAEYRVSCFRCGGYSAQPFERIYDALAENEIFCDSSVYFGGADPARGYDFRSAYSEHQPYYADRFDSQLKAPAVETAIVELPIFAPEPGRRWCLDGTGVQGLSCQFSSSQARVPETLAPVALRAMTKLLETLSCPPRVRRVLERGLRRRIYRPIAEDSLPSDYFVMIGHTKAQLNFEKLGASIESLKAAGCRVESLDYLARYARVELSDLTRLGGSKNDERTKSLIEKVELKLTLSDEFADRIPLDRERILLVKPHRNQPNPLGELRPWAVVSELGSTCLEESLENCFPVDTACNTFDCVQGPHFLYTHPDPDRVLADAYQVLRSGGLFVTIVPQVPERKRLLGGFVGSSASIESIAARMKNVGFVNVIASRIAPLNEFYFPAKRRTRRRFRDAIGDTIRDRIRWLGRGDPSQRFMWLAGWKRAQPISRFDRMLEAMDWVYRRLNPAAPDLVGIDPHALIRGQKGLCIDYCIVLGAMLTNEGFDVEWVTMAAHDHPHGTGALKRDTHEVLQVRIDGHTVIVDPMTNTWHPGTLFELLREPNLAIGKVPRDGRYLKGEYDLYDTAEWYSRVKEFKIRRDIAMQEPFTIWRKNPYPIRFLKNTTEMNTKLPC